MSRTLSVVLLLVLTGCRLREPVVESSAELIHITEAMMLHPPLELVRLTRWRDGGSLGFAFEDIRATRLEFSFDGGAHSPTRGRWYLGSLHPSHGGAMLLERAGRTEQALQQVLRHWVTQHFTPDELAQLTAQNWAARPGEDRLKSDVALVVALLERAAKPAATKEQ